MSPPGYNFPLVLAQSPNSLKGSIDTTFSPFVLVLDCVLYKDVIEALGLTLLYNTVVLLKVLSSAPTSPSSLGTLFILSPNRFIIDVLSVLKKEGN